MRRMRGVSWPLEVADGVYQLLAARATVTAILGGDETLLVDTGGRGSLALIADGLKALGRSLESVRLVALTHCHPDHVGSVDRVVRATSARVAAHVAEAEFLAGARPYPTPFSNRLLATAARPFLKRTYGAPVPVDVPLEDGARLPSLEEVRVIHTPGHTAGSICLFLPARGVLLVGDALQLLRGRLAPPSAMYTADMRQAWASVRRLASLDVQVVSFSHFPPLRENPRRALSALAESLAP